MPHDNLPQPRKNATKWAIGFTAVWLCCFFVLLFIKRCTISELALNEWGDLIAGTFAPLAFFWLVYGYFQQGLELRLSREALLLQQKELAEQVKATLELAKHSEAQARSSAELVNITLKKDQGEREQRTPVFKFSRNGHSGLHASIEVANIRGDAYDLCIEYENASSARIYHRALKNGESFGFTVEITTPIICLTCKCFDRLGDPIKYLFQYSHATGEFKALPQPSNED